MVLLKINKLSKNFGGLRAVDNLDFEVHDSEILGLLGPNGSGKTTVFNMISGFFAPTEGRIFFEGNDITGLRADEISRKGICRTFQASILFMESTVFENVLFAYHKHYREPAWKAFFHTPSSRDERKAAVVRTMEILELMGLTGLKGELAKNLSHGHQRILGLCIAMAGNPKILLLDEPLTGMNPSESFIVMDKVKQIRDLGVTVVLIEHNMRSVMRVCDRLIVLSYGIKIAEGLPQEIQKNKEVIEAYLGRDEGIINAD